LTLLYAKKILRANEITVLILTLFRYDGGMKEKEKNQTLVLIDSNAIIHRAYHALPKTMSLPGGEMTNAVYGYTTTLIKVMEDLKPDFVAATFDLAGPTFRHDEYKEYKATRVKADQELYDQIPRVRELLETLRIPVYEKAGFEADDAIGTIVTLIRNTKYKIQIYIVTGDRDTFQLVDGDIFVYNLKHGLNNAQIVDRAEIEKEWHLQPEDFIDLKALAGDPSDNIPGVPGIGPKTATDLLQRFDTLKKLYEKIESEFSVISSPVIENRVNSAEKSPGQKDPHASRQVGLAQDDKLVELVAKKLDIKPRILNLLIDNKEQAFLSQKLATIRRDVPLDFKLEDCRFGDYDKDEVVEFFKMMRFHSLLRRFSIEKSEPTKTQEAKEQKKKDDQLSLL